MKEQVFPYENYLMRMKEGEEDVIYIKGRPFLIAPATEDDIERINKGYFVMD